MIGLIAKMPVASGMEAAFESGFANLAAIVKADEPGCTLYRLVKSREAAPSYVVMELYETEEALSAHGKSDAFRAAAAALGPCLVGKPEISRYDVVV